jgi:hypothetical protein
VKEGIGMARLLMDNQKLMVLLILTFSISLGGLGDAEAALKSKFQYEKHLNFSMKSQTWTSG